MPPPVTMFFQSQGKIGLTQISVTSERPCQVGGGSRSPPIYLGSRAKFSPKLIFPWKVASIPTHLTLFQNFFSITPPKISENWFHWKIAKNEWNFQNLWFLSYFNLQYLKKTHFLHRLQFQTKKVWFIWKKIRKNQIFWIFFFKIDTDQLSSIAIFSNLWQGITKLSCSMFWKGFEDKSHQRRAHYLKPRRNGGPIPTGGGSRSPPPHWLGLRFLGVC